MFGAPIGVDSKSGRYRPEHWATGVLSAEAGLLYLLACGETNAEAQTIEASLSFSFHLFGSRIK
jgi:hypothetical protein